METAVEDPPKKAILRPKGRPKKDSVSPSALKEKPFPGPPRATEKHGIVPADKFWGYRKSLPPEYLDRLTYYVYREWPKLDFLQNLTLDELEEIRQKKRQKPVKYIGQYADLDPDNWRNELLRYHGSGDFKIYMNDTGVRGNPALKATVICRTWISLRDDEMPPIISDLSILDLNDPINTSYIQQLRMKGVVIPGDAPQTAKEETDDMATNIAVETLAKLAEQGSKPSVDNTANMLQEMLRQSEARHQREIEALTKRLESAEARPAPHDDLATTRAVIEMAKSVTQSAAPLAPPPPPQDNKMVDILMQMLKSTEERTLQERKLDAERHARDLEMLNKRLEAQELRAADLEKARLAQATATPGKSAIQEAISLVKALRGATEEINGGNEGTGNVWADLAGELGPRVLDTIGTVANAFKASTATAPQQQQAPATSNVPAIQQQAPQQQGDPQMNMILNMMKKPILGALRQGVPGHVFGAQIVAQYGEQPYRMATEKGESGLFQMLQSDGEFWGQLLQIGAPTVQSFITAFLNEEAVSAALQQMAAQQQQRPVQPPPAGRPANQPRPATVVDATPASGGRTIITGDGTPVKTKANGVPNVEGVA